MIQTRSAIRSKRALTPAGEQEAVIVMTDGVIEAVLPYDALVNCPVHDVGNNILMPGIIDPHVHINEPGRIDWEGFDTATRAALAGGLTTLVDMPLNSSPVTTSAKAFDKKLVAAKNSLHVNCGFWGGIVPGNQTEIEKLIARGILGFKAFLTHSGIDDFPNVTGADLRKAMPLIARHKLPLLVHCELSEPSAGKLASDNYTNYLNSRPKAWEDNAVALMIRLCEEFNCRVHVVHLSSASSVQQIALAKQKGLFITAETGQHYLYFNAEDIADGQTQFKCAPPIREKKNNDQLWEALKSGIIDFVATDHSPAPPGLKELESGDFMKAWGGISSLQFALPVLWTACRKRGLDVSMLVKWLCEGPSKLAGLDMYKGKLAPGFDADLVVWDAEASFTLAPGQIYHKHKITPYLGEKLYGIVSETYIAGKKLFSRDEGMELHGGQLILSR